MATIGRRSFLGFLAAIGVVGTGDVGLAAQPSLLPAALARRRAIIALRVLNTIQAKHVGAYVSVEEFVASRRKWIDSASEKAGFQVFDLTGWHNGSDLVPGFQLASQLTSDRSAYTYLLVSRTDRSSYKTDQTGVIYEGSVSIDAALNVAAVDELANRFSGVPFERKEGLTTAPGAVGRVIATVTGFLFPVLSARVRNICCEDCTLGNCCGGCQQQCGDCTCNEGPQECCNLGGLTCTWCCKMCSGEACQSPNCCDCTITCL